MGDVIKGPRGEENPNLPPDEKIYGDVEYVSGNRMTVKRAGGSVRMTLLVNGVAANVSLRSDQAKRLSGWLDDASADAERAGR